MGFGKEFAAILIHYNQGATASAACCLFLPTNQVTCHWNTDREKPNISLTMFTSNSESIRKMVSAVQISCSTSNWWNLNSNPEFSLQKNLGNLVFGVGTETYTRRTLTWKPNA